MKKGKRKFLVIGAHPDDADFICGGTVAKLTDEGHECIYAVITSGHKGDAYVRASSAKLAKMREEEQLRAAEVVGVSKVVYLGETDGELENTPEVREKICAVIRKFKPDVVLTFDPASRSYDNFYLYHRDHRVCGEAVFDAIYPAAGSAAFFPKLLKTGLSPHQISEVWFFASERPNHFVNIGKTINKKIKALEAHTSQVGDMKNVKKWVKEFAGKTGRKKGMRYAEAFRKLTF